MSEPQGVLPHAVRSEGDFRAPLFGKVRKENEDHNGSQEDKEPKICAGRAETQTEGYHKKDTGLGRKVFLWTVEPKYRVGLRLFILE